MQSQSEEREKQNVPTENVDTKDVSTKNVDTKDVSTKNVDTKDWLTENTLAKKYKCVCAVDNCEWWRHTATEDEDTRDVPTETADANEAISSVVFAIDLATVHYVADQAQNVSINMLGVDKIEQEVLHYMIHNLSLDFENFAELSYRYVRLSSVYHPKPDDLGAADWLFVINTLNFALWTGKNEQEWKVDGETGYLALCAAIKRAIDGGKPMWDPKFYKDLSMTDMKDIFRGDDNNDIPRISQRLKILHDVGKVLLESYNGTFETCISSCVEDAMQLMTILLTFPSFYECPTYDERSVGLYNKAWILTADISSFFDQNHSLNIVLRKYLSSTIFADYRVLQIFDHFKALVYNENFLDKLKEQDEIVMYGSREELEIRCCSLEIVLLLQEKLMKSANDYVRKKRPDIDRELDLDFIMCLIDNFLWDYRQNHDKELRNNVLCKISTEQY